MVSKAIEKKILDALDSPEAKRSLAESMVQPVRRAMQYSGLGRKMFNLRLDNAWICRSCWVSGIDGPKDFISMCPKCDRQVDTDTIPEGVLWTYDDKWF